MEPKPIGDCTHFRHPPDEQLLHVDIFFSNYYNLKSVHSELKWMVGGQVNPIISIILDDINNNNIIIIIIIIMIIIITNFSSGGGGKCSH